MYVRVCVCVSVCVFFRFYLFLTAFVVNKRDYYYATHLYCAECPIGMETGRGALGHRGLNLI